MRNIWGKYCRKSQNILFFVQQRFFRILCRLLNSVEKYLWNQWGHQRRYNIVQARCMQDRKGYTLARACTHPSTRAHAHTHTHKHARAHKHIQTKMHFLLFHCYGGFLQASQCYISFNQLSFDSFAKNFLSVCKTVKPFVVTHVVTQSWLFCKIFRLFFATGPLMQKPAPQTFPKAPDEHGWSQSVYFPQSCCFIVQVKQRLCVSTKFEL